MDATANRRQLGGVSSGSPQRLSPSRDVQGRGRPREDVEIAGPFEGVRYVALLAFVTVLAGGTAFAAVEDKPKAWDGIWWAATTMSTVGYGDITPATDAGRVIGLFVMVVGIGLGSILIGAVAERFVQRDVQTETAEVERQLAATDDDLLSELRDLSARLARIEAALGDRTSPGGET
jgi:voltage-gated potassium channel